MAEVIDIQKKNYGLDFLKFIFAISVVILHVLPINDKNFWLGNGLCRLAVPFFFFISGYYSDRGVSRKVGFSSFLKFLSPYIVAFLFWMIVYSFYAYKKIFVLIEPSSIPIYIGKLFYVFFYKEGYFHLWYLLAVIYGLLFLFIAQKLKIKDSLLFIISLVFFYMGAVSTTYRVLMPDCIIFSCVKFIGYPVFFAFPMISLGFLFNKHAMVSLSKIKKISLFLGAFLCLFVLESFYIRFCLPKGEFFDMFLLHPFVIPLIFIYSLTINVRSNDYFSCSGEVYFLHPLIISFVSWTNWDLGQLWLHLLLVIIITSVISYYIHPYLYKMYRFLK